MNALITALVLAQSHEEGSEGVPPILVGGLTFVLLITLLLVTLSYSNVANRHAQHEIEE